MWSNEAEELILGTALVESRLSYLHQVDGPAIGLLQMELPTAMDILRRYVAQKDRHFRIRVENACMIMAPWDLSDEGIQNHLQINLAMQVALARLKYWMVEEPIPVELGAMAEYWKDYYNTNKGHGHPKMFIREWRENVERT